MADDTRLGANFAIDTTDLKAGLAQANRLIRESESEFRAAAAGLDDWTESEEGLSAKVKSLNSVTELQRQKVSALQREYDRLIDNGLDPASREATELRTKINNETTALKKNEAELKKQNKALGDFADKSKNAGDGAEKMSLNLGDMASTAGVALGAITAVAAAVTAAVGSFLGLAESTREYRREMAQLSQNAKDSGADLDSVKDKLAEVSAVTGEADAAMEGMNMLMATGLDTSQIEIASDALAGAATRFDGLKFEGMAEGLQETLATGVAVGPFAELIERTGGDLEAFNAGLANCTTEAERQAYAMQFLTQSGLVEANAEYKKMNEDLYNAEMAQYNLNDALAELGKIAEPIMTVLKVLATDVLTAIQPFVSLIGEGLKGALEGSAGATEMLAEGFGGLLNSLVDKVSEIVPSVLSVIAQILPKIAQTLISNVPKLYQTVINIVIQLIDTLTATFPQILQAAYEIVPLIYNQLISAVPQLLEAAIQLLMAIVEAVPTIVAELVTALPTMLDTIINAVLEAYPMLIDAAIQLLMAIIDAIPTILTALYGAMPKIISSIISGLLKALPTLLKSAVKLWTGIVDAIFLMIPTLVKMIPQIITAIVSGLGDGISQIKDAGADMIRGLWEGISDMSGWISKKIKGFSKDVLGGIKDFFGIKSPSRVMADQVGKNLALGIGQGFEKNISAVNDEIADAMNFEDANFSANAQNGKFGLSRVATVINYTNNFKQAYTSQREKYKAQQELLATMRLAKVGV